jgi:hypothetical protein
LTAPAHYRHGQADSFLKNGLIDLTMLDTVYFVYGEYEHLHPEAPAIHGHRARCTASPQGRNLFLNKHDALQREHRQRAANSASQDDYRTHRTMVERSIAWLTRGNRRFPHRGISPNNAWLQLRIAGLNLRFRDSTGSWVLA